MKAVDGIMVCLNKARKVLKRERLGSGDELYDTLVKEVDTHFKAVKKAKLTTIDSLIVVNGDEPIVAEDSPPKAEKPPKTSGEELVAELEKTVGCLQLKETLEKLVRKASGGEFKTEQHVTARLKKAHLFMADANRATILGVFKFGSELLKAQKFFLNLIVEKKVAKAIRYNNFIY